MIVARSGALRPVSVRILGRLPGPDWGWIVVWALIPWLNAGANFLRGREQASAVWEQSRALVLLNYGALSFGVAVTLWGTERIVRRLETLQSGVPGRQGSEHFRELRSVAIPLVVSAAASLAFAADSLVRDGWAAAVLRGATWFVIGVPLWTFLWTYASLQLGLHRLGRARLLRDASPVDPSLGLRPLGDVAFMALWMLLVWLVPIVWTGLPDVPGLAIGLAVLGVGLAIFFLSLRRLHRQMVDVKASEVAIARELYAQAYEPVRKAHTLEVLEQQQGLLSAADALEKRARAIHEWPVDEGTFARVATIATSVVAATIGRLILEPIGL